MCDGVQDKDIVSEESLREACEAADIERELTDNLIGQIEEASVKDELKRSTQEALDLGVGCVCVCVCACNILWCRHLELRSLFFMSVTRKKCSLVVIGLNSLPTHSVSHTLLPAVLIIIYYR